MLDYLVVSNCSHSYAPISPCIIFSAVTPILQLNGALPVLLEKIKLTTLKPPFEVELLLINTYNDYTNIFNI